jgi:hypothetical protein
MFGFGLFCWDTEMEENLNFFSKIEKIISFLHLVLFFHTFTCLSFDL